MVKLNTLLLCLCVDKNSSSGVLEKYMRGSCYIGERVHANLVNNPCPH
jgi:hypothetical protein